MKGMFEPEVIAPEGMFEPGLQFLIEDVSEASEALGYYTEVKRSEMDQHTTIVIQETISTLKAVLVFLKQVQEYERAQAQAATGS
jgi:hypothetical protein